MLIRFIKKNWLILSLGLVGLLSGFIYWQQIGCNNGSCSIKSSPYKMTLWGGVMGGLLGSMIHDLIKKKKTITD